MIRGHSPVVCLAEVKHWTFNDPPKREGKCADEPPSPEEFLKLGACVVELHPMTVIQDARTSGGGNVSAVPTQALTIGPQKNRKVERVSIWHAGRHDNPFGARLTSLMISKRIADCSLPMSLLALHPNVRFGFHRPSMGTRGAEMH